MPSVRSAAVAVLAAAAVAVPVSPASAAAFPPGAAEPCRIQAEPPRALGTFYTTAAGSFECAIPQEMWLTVCLEVLDGVDLTRQLWRPISCGETMAFGNHLSADTIGCEWGLFVYRSNATGSAGGRTYQAASAPVPFYCSPL